MLDELSKELQSEPKTEEEVLFGTTSDPVEEFNKLWETAASQFVEQSKSLDELSSRLNQSKRMTVPEAVKQLHLLTAQTYILVKTLHKKLEQEVAECDESTKAQQ